MLKSVLERAKSLAASRTEVNGVPLYPSKFGPVYLLNVGNADFVNGSGPMDRSDNRPWSPLAKIIGVLVVLIGIVFSIYQWRNANAISNQGVNTQAVVIGRDTKTSDSDTVAYYVTYQYWVHDQPYTHTSQLSGSGTYDEMVGGAHVQVTYSPDNPQVVELTNSSDVSVNAGLVSIVTAIIAFVVLVSMLLAQQRAARADRLEKEGQLLPGNVLSARIVRRWDTDGVNTYKLHLNYQFQSPTNRQLDGYSKAELGQTKGQPVPTSGTHLAIVYVNDRLYQVL